MTPSTASRASLRTDDGAIAWGAAAPYLAGVTLLVVGYLPLVFLGPGTDLDSAGVYRAGRSILQGDYMASRRPGAPVYEAMAGALDALGGVVLVNLASVALAAALAWAVVHLLRAEKHPNAEWLGVAVLANPFVWVAGTSMADHIAAIAFAVLGAVALRTPRWWLAAVCFVLAIGCRLPTALLVAAILLAAWVGADATTRRRVLRVGAATALAAVVVFVPPALTLGREMFATGVAASSVPVLVGRWVVKNISFFGVVLLVTAAVLAPGIARGTRRGWRTSYALRVGALVLVAAELLFLAFPWKLAHLIPAWIGLVLVLGSTRVVTNKVMAVLLAAQLLHGAVALNVAQPDVRDAATGGRLAPSIEPGPLLRDVRCRLDSDRDAYRRPDGSDAVLPVWACVVPWSGDTR